MIRPMFKRLVPLLAVLLTACSHYEPLSLHGAASMRVEVEVYKGPLTSPIEGQIGELMGVVTESIQRISEWREGAFGRYRNECRSEKIQLEKSHDSCDHLKEAIVSATEYLSSACYSLRTDGDVYFILGHYVYIPEKICEQSKSNSSYYSSYFRQQQSDDDKKFSDSINIASLRRDEYILRSSSTKIAENRSQPCRDSSGLLDRLSKCGPDAISITFENLSATLKGSAHRTIGPFVGRVPFSEINRRYLVEYADIASDYGEQIHSRVISLQKVANYGSDAEPTADGATPVLRSARTLPVSDYLRSTGKTDYIQLYDWLQGLNPFSGSVSLTKLSSPADRIRMAQRLTADDYWQKVNEVYASGQGTVAMAFIKDDLGNWDLKSFSNDPADLLASYRRVADAALKTAASLASKATTGGVGDAARLTDAAKATQLANQLATGEAPATPGVVGGVNLAALHDRTAARIAAQKVRFALLETQLQAEHDKQAGAATKATEDAKAADGEAKSANDALTTVADARDTAFATETKKLADLATELGHDAPSPVTVKSAEDALSIAQKDREKKQAAVDDQQAAVFAAKAKVAKLRTDADDATAKSAAADQRLKDLPKEAIEAVKGTLDDHLAVIAALQEGVASASQPGPAAATSVPGR